ncbi:MAG: carbon monoxide dehydrogenase subunit G [Pseudomonadota bacterium]
MELQDQIKINASREHVFAALNDVDILRQAIPGCEEIDSNGPDAFTATVSQKIGPLKTRFKGDVTLSDIVPPESYKLEGSGKAGPAGHVKVRANVHLDEDGTGTMLRYEVTADIGGKLAQLGGHLVERTSKKLSGEFFSRIEELIDSPQPSETAAEKESSESETTESNTILWAGAFIAMICAALWVFL